MSKKKKIIIISLLIIVIIGIITGVFINIKMNKKSQVPTKTIEVLDSIKGYDYKLEDRDTEFYKEKFLELKKVLENENIDDEKYASLLAELFAIDLYTIDNKNSKYDVGAIDFIYNEEQEKFKNKVTDTMYKLVEDNSTNNRKQELPVVNNTEITSITETKYLKGENKLNGYEINLEISYEKDLGYDTKVVIIVVKESEKMYVVSLTTEEI